jgi:hypothetical protein
VVERATTSGAASETPTDAVDVPASKPANSPTVVISGEHSDLSSLGSRIVRRTTDLIVIAVIVGVALTVTLRVVDWWRAEPESLTANLEAAFSRDALAPWGAGASGTQVRLGEAPFTLARVDFQGTLDGALTRLEERCAASIAVSSKHDLPVIEDSEAQLIARLSRETPSRKLASEGGSLYRLPGPVPMVIAVGSGAGRDAGIDRVLCWGLAMPFDAQQWNLLLVTPGTGGGSDFGGAVGELPDGARHGMTVRDDIGGSLTTFSGAGPAEAWKSHFNVQAASEAWRDEGGWTTTGGHWSAVWTTERNGRRERIDIHLLQSAGGWTGVRQVTPLAGTNQAGEP